jgi:hypothetical protein
MGGRGAANDPEPLSSSFFSGKSAPLHFPTVHRRGHGPIEGSEQRLLSPRRLDRLSVVPAGFFILEHVMTTYQEKRIVQLLDDMAKTAVDLERKTPGEIIGGLQYLIWEARQTLELPDVPGLEPI